MQALFFLRKEKRWLVEKMVKEEYYEKESIIVKLMAGIHIFILIDLQHITNHAHLIPHHILVKVYLPTHLLSLMVSIFLENDMGHSY